MMSESEMTKEDQKKVTPEAALAERTETILRGEVAQKDERGIIRNYHLPEPVTMIGWITAEQVFKKNWVRANHYHPVQEQKVLVISGKYISVYKDLQNSWPVRHHLAQAGDLVVTPPRVAHAMIFLEDTLLLNLVNGNRDSKEFDKHTIPYVLVDPQDQAQLEKYLVHYR